MSAASEPENTSADYDGAWKEALDRYLTPFLRLCFPWVHAQIDWNCEVVPLETELREVVRDAESGKGYVDKLVRVCGCNGSTQWVLVHIEVQSQPDRQLAERMYRYHHRIRWL